MYGDNLAAAHPYNVKMMFHSLALPVVPVNHQKLLVQFPPGTGGNYPFFVNVQQRNSTRVLSVSYDVPYIDKI